MILHYETREVLAAAYRRRSSSMLTHRVIVDDQGRDLEAFCTRVELESIADRNSGVDIQSEPTCSRCQRAPTNPMLREERARCDSPKMSSK